MQFAIYIRASKEVAPLRHIYTSEAGANEAFSHEWRKGAYSVALFRIKNNPSSLGPEQVECWIKTESRR